jgi:polyisoprenoid-binding protein YceI
MKMRNLKFLTAFVAIAFGLSVSAQEYKVNTTSSTIHWVGKKIGGSHNGNIGIKEGSFKVEKNKIVSGNFVVDMSSITDNDLEGEWNAKLVGHLKSDDFFGVEKYPTSKLEITEGGAFKNGEAKVKGKLTIKDKTNPVEFVVKKSGDTYSTTLVVDRSKYDVRYGSKSFFDNLGDKAIENDFTLEIKVVADK